MKQQKVKFERLILVVCDALTQKVYDVGPFILLLVGKEHDQRKREIGEFVSKKRGRDKERVYLRIIVR